MNDSSLPNSGSSQQLPPNPENSSAQAILGHGPDLERLESALGAIPPSDDIKVIAYHYLVPMTKAAIEFPEIQEPINALALKWASGGLHDGKYPGLMAITKGGLTGKSLFDALWMHFMTDTQYKGPRRSLGSIYHIAKVAGWTYGNPPDFHRT